MIVRRHQSFLLGPFRLGSGKHTALHGSFRILYKMKLLPINIGICWIVLSERPGSSDSEAIRVIFSWHNSFLKKNRFESIVEQILFCVLRRIVHNTYHRVTYYLQFLSDFSIALSLSRQPYLGPPETDIGASFPDDRPWRFRGFSAHATSLLLDFSFPAFCFCLNCSCFSHRAMIEV